MNLETQKQNNSVFDKQFLSMAAIVIIITSVIAGLLFYATQKYVLQHAENEIQDLLLTHKGIHHYVQCIMHPAFYNYKEKGEIKEYFYAPELLSSSFIVRNQHSFYNQERVAIGLPELYYKLAAINSRNPVNKADAMEEKLIKMFNEQRDLKEYSEVIQVDSKKYLYVALPFSENQKSCAKCHGKRKDAPRQLQERYKGQGGFDENEKDIRAIISIRAPLDREYFNAYIIFSTLLAGVIAIISLFIFNNRLKRVVHIRTKSLEQEVIDRKQAEVALLVSEERFKALHNASFGGVIIHDQGIILDCNQGLSDMTGFANEELVGMDVLELIAPDWLDQVVENIKRGYDQRYEVEGMRKDGSVYSLAIRGKNVYYKGCESRVFEFQDISEIKLAEEKLRKREHLLSSIFRAASTGIGVVVNRVFQQVNKRFCEILGYSEEELLGKNTRMIYSTDEEHENVGLALNAQIGEHGVGTVETNFIHKDGKIVNALVSLAPLDVDDLSRGLTFVFIDMTEMKNTERKLHQSENKFRSMMESMSDQVYICSDDYRVEYMNPAMVKRTGRDATGDFCYKALHDFNRPCSWCKGKDEYNGKHFESDIVNPKDNHSYHVSFSPIVNEDGSVSDLIVSRDITVTKMLEAQLIQSQKMESIGTLAGGIAHDFNNILSAILGFSEMALLDLPDGSNARQDIDQVIKSGKRAAELVLQILTFSRKEPLSLEILNPYPIIKEALKMQRSALPTTIKIEEDIDPECGEVQADPTQLHQVVMNLCTNAFQSMEDQMGVLKVKLWRTEIADKKIAGEPGTSAGQFIVLSVFDTGCGMDETMKERIFEPYFTTKEVGKGTGLGLAVIHGIIESYKGFIKVESEPGRGSTFHVYIPVLDKNIAAPLQETKKDGSLPGGTESIMVVDDEEAILDLHEKILERLGYKVTPATDSLIALEKIRLDPDQFDLIFTDQSMPNLSGAGLAREVLKIKPTMPIILCTGYSSVVSEKDAMAIGIKRYAKKPVELKELARIVRQVLDES